MEKREYLIKVIRLLKRQLRLTLVHLINRLMRLLNKGMLLR